MLNSLKEKAHLLLDQAMAGDVSSMIEIGNIYIKSTDQEDLISGFEWFKQAAESKNKDALLKYAECLYFGKGCEQDYESALVILFALADENQPKAAYYVGQAYSLSRGLIENQQLAYEYYLIAANSGHLRAMFFVARRLRSGIGVVKNTKESNKWLTKLTKLNYPDALHYIGYCYENALGYRTNYVKSFEFFLKAAELDHLESIYEVGLAYHHGVGTKKNITKAQEYFISAQQKGHKKAIYFITNPTINETKEKLLLIGISEPDVTAIYSSLCELEEAFLIIRARHTLKKKTEVAHFTRWEALESILPTENHGPRRNHLRRYNVDYLNDPMEGHRLLNRHINTNNANAKWVSEKLSRIYSEKYYSNFSIDKPVGELLPSVYTVSFTESIDRLELWRAYGADGDGYCITIPVSEKSDPLSVRRHKASQINFHKGDYATECEEESDTTPWLYRIIYDDATIDRNLQVLHTPLHKLDAISDSLPMDARELIDYSIASILIELLHLYKDEQYSAEKEVRSLITLRMNDNRVELDSRSNAPGRIYCKTGNFLFQEIGSKIIIGPKVKNQQDAIWNLRYKLHKNGFAHTTSVIPSKVKYR